MKNAVIMAAGKGTRMKSDLPKVLHKLMEEEMISIICDNVKEAGAERVIAIVGYGHELVEKKMEGRCEFALQQPQLGTGHAVMQAKQLEGSEGKTLVVNGDCPCVKVDTYASLFDALDEADMVVLTCEPEDAASYGRIIRDENGNVEKIVEFKDCNEEEKQVKEINTGIYAFDNVSLFEGLKLLKNENAQHEYYITDLVEILKGMGKTVKAVKTEDWEEVQGINDNAELARATKYMQKRINTYWMKEGVTIMDPDNTYIGTNVKIGHDVMIYPNSYIFGDVSVESGTIIMPGTWIRK